MRNSRRNRHRTQPTAREIVELVDRGGQLQTEIEQGEAARRETRAKLVELGLYRSCAQVACSTGGPKGLRRIPMGQ